MIEMAVAKGSAGDEKAKSGALPSKRQRNEKTEQTKIDAEPPKEKRCLTPEALYCPSVGPRSLSCVLISRAPRFPVKYCTTHWVITKMRLRYPIR